MRANGKKTPLNSWHVACGASMAEFGGYAMPLWYSSAKNEHLAVLTHAGVFDTSHMAVILLEGRGAYELVQLCFTNDLDRCIGSAKKPIYAGRCAYGAFLDESGGVIDDAIVYALGQDTLMIVVNAGMGSAVALHLERHRRDLEVAITDLTDQVSKIDVQGPLAAKIIGNILMDPQEVFGRMPYFSFKGFFNGSQDAAASVRLKNQTPILLSRTGYTGEFGFELFVGSEQTEKVWETIMDAGQEFGAKACGLAARDSLRAGAVLPLSHQDMGPWPFIYHPWQFVLPFNGRSSDFTKVFIGDQALLRVENPEFTYAFVGHDLRKISVSDPTMVLDGCGNPIGRVLTCVTDMGIGWHEGRIYSVASPGKPKGFEAHGLCCGFLKVRRRLEEGDDVILKDNRRRLNARITGDIRPDRTARRPIQDMT